MTTLEDAMETSRDEHKQKTEAKLKEWSAHLSALQAKTEQAAADTKAKLLADLEELKKLEASGRQHVETLANKTWDEFKTEATEQWNKVSGAFDAVWARISQRP
jgi:predicted RNase H-like nuclease (RuvC/YqgF family)